MDESRIEALEGRRRVQAGARDEAIAMIKAMGNMAVSADPAMIPEIRKTTEGLFDRCEAIEHSMAMTDLEIKAATELQDLRCGWQLGPQTQSAGDIYGDEPDDVLQPPDDEDDLGL